jgi:hypothetical protein
MPDDTFYPDANPETTTVDGQIYRFVSSETWSAIRDAASGTGRDDSTPFQDITLISHGSSSDRWTFLGRCVLLFDLSSLAGLSVTAASLNLRVGSTIDDFGDTLDVVDSAPASNTGLVTGDYSSLGSTSFGSVSIASLTNNSYNAITLNGSGVAAIAAAAGGIAKLGLRFGSDRTNTAPTWAASKASQIQYQSAESATTRPYLLVTHTSAPSILAGEGRSGVSARAVSQTIILASVASSDRVAANSRDASGAAAATIAKSHSAARDSGLQNANASTAARSLEAASARTSNVTLALAAGYSRDYATAKLQTFSRAFVLALDEAATIDSARTTSLAYLNVRDFASGYSGVNATVVVAGAIAAIGRPLSVISSGAFGVLMTPLVAMGNSRSTSRSACSAPKSTAGLSGLSEETGRATKGNNLGSAFAIGRDVATNRSRGKAGSRAPVSGRDFRTAESSSSTRAMARIAGARSFTVRRSVGVFRIVVTARGLAEARSRDSASYRVIVSAPGYSVAPERDGAAPPVSTAGIRARSLEVVRSRQTTLSACFVAGASVAAAWDRPDAGNVSHVVAASRESSRDSGVTLAAMFTSGRSSTSDRDAGNPLAIAATAGRSIDASRETIAPLTLALTVGLSLAVSRDASNRPFSFAGVVVQDRVALESSGRMITTVDLHASDAARASSSISTVNAIAAFIVGEPGLVVIN